MEHKPVELKREAWSAARKKAKALGKLAEAFLSLGEHSYDPEAWNTLYNELVLPLLQNPAAFQRLEQFYTPELSKLLRELTDKDYEAQFPALLLLRAEGQFSSSPLRRSHRTSQLSVYLAEWLHLLAGFVRSYYYTGSLYDWLFAIYGDSSEIKLSRKMIEAIILCGQDDLLEDLMKLLLAAKLQEGLRQQILESADKGSTATLTKIVKCCLDNDLFRFSSAVRALDTWTGLPYDDARPARARKCAQLAYEVLSDEEKRKTYGESSDCLELYFALWGQACHELSVTVGLVDKLLAEENRSRRIVGWYFVRNTELASYRMARAVQHLDEQDEETLAWVCSCLVQTTDLCSAYYIKRNSKSFPNTALPQDREARRRAFFALMELAARIGNKKRSFNDLPFPGIRIALSCEPVVGCMLSLAGHEMDSALVRELPKLLPWMNADQKMVLISYFLHPDTGADDRAVLMELLEDRSVYVKERAVKSLAACSLSPEELRALAAALRSKSSNLRSAILPTLRDQPRELLLPLLSEMLQSPEEMQNQAAIELITELKAEETALPDRYRSELAGLRERKLSTQTEILLDQLLPKAKSPVYTPENGFGLYDPGQVSAYRETLDQTYALPKQGVLGKLFGKLPEGVMSEQAIRALFPAKTEVNTLITRLAQIFLRHADYEYETDNYDGSRSKRLFGDMTGYWFPLPAGSGCNTVNDPSARRSSTPSPPSTTSTATRNGKSWNPGSRPFGTRILRPCLWARNSRPCSPRTCRAVRAGSTLFRWYVHSSVCWSGNLTPIRSSPGLSGSTGA